MKTFKTKSMALLLAVLMLLSSVVTGTFAFTASAEEEPETDASTPEVSLYRQNGEFIAEGSLVDMNALAKAKYADSNLVCKINKDIELDAPIVFQSKRIAIFDGQGHTIYFSKNLLENNSSFISFHDTQGVDTFSITFKNLNFSGQPMDWDGEKTTAIYYGTVGQDSGAIAVHKNIKLTFDNCRLENFYANARGACFYFTGVNATADQGEALPNRGLWLKDTVITNNYSGNTGAASATVIRTRYGNVGSQVHVSGSTYIDNNYDANGDPFANIYVAKGTGAATYASSVLRVESDFTGAVATNAANSVAPSKDSETGEVTMVGTVYFDGAYDPTDGGFVYAWRGAGNTNKDLIVPVDATKASEAQRVQASNSNVFYYLDYLDSNKTWVNDTAKNAFIALEGSADKDGTYTEAERLAAAKKNLIVLTGDVSDFTMSTESSGMYTVWGNGHELRSKTATGEIPMIRYGDEDPNTTVIFNDLVMNGDVRVSVGDDDYLEFDQISTEADETDVKGIGAGNGGALGSYYKDQYIVLNNVEIKNFVQTRCNWAPASDARQGAAIHDNAGSVWHLNNVNIHDNYTGRASSAVYAKNANTKFYFAGDIKFENNYMTEYKTGNGSVVDNFTIVREADVWLNHYGNMYFDETAVAESVIMGNNCSNGSNFAFIAEEAMENVKFFNSQDKDLVPSDSGDSTIAGYVALEWKALPEDVTFTIYGKDGTTVVIEEWEKSIIKGAALPVLEGLTWYNDEEAVTTHIKGVRNYVGKWAEGAEQVVMYSTDNRLSWSTGSDLNVITSSTTLATDIELLCDYEQSSSYTIDYKAIFVFDGNGYTISVPEGSSLTNLYSARANATTQTTKTFKNITFDGTGWTTIAEDGAMITHGNNSGTLAFDGCTFKNIQGTGDAGVFRPTGNTTLKLEDCTFTYCSGDKGTIRTGYYGTTTRDISPLIVLEGNTTMTGENNRIYLNGCGVLAVSGNFTGTVDVYGNAMSTVEDLAWTAIDRVVAYPGLEEKATVAEGATITGKIYNTNDTTGATFAYDNNGVLCWGDKTSLEKVSYNFNVGDGEQVIKNGKYAIGFELPTPRKFDLTGEAPVVYIAEWFYDKEGVKTPTTVTVKGFDHYYVGDYTVDAAVEAFVSKDNFGTLKEVLAAAKAGDRIEFVRDIYLSEQATVAKNLTLDGNGCKLSFQLDDNGKAVLRDYLLHVNSNLNVLFTDIVFDGGGTKDVWDQDIQAPNQGFVEIGTVTLTDTTLGITYNNCTFQGLRVFSTTETFSAIGVNGYRTTFTGNTLITDNMFRAAQYKYNESGALYFPMDDDGNYIPATTENCETKDKNGDVVTDSEPVSKLGAVIRCDQNTALYLTENVRIYGNYGLYVNGEDVRVGNCNLLSGGTNTNPGHKSVVIGPLADDADIWATFTNGYMVVSDENGVPYNVGNKVKNKDGTQSYNYLVSVHNPNAAYEGVEDSEAKDLAFHTSIGGDVAAIVRTGSSGSLIVGSASGMALGGNIRKDRFTLDIYLTMRANVSETLTISLGNTEISSKAVAEYGLPISRTLTASDSYGWYKVSVDVGMAQLTDTISVVLTDKDGNQLGAVYTTTAKDYVGKLLEETDEKLASTGADATKLRVALVSLLQYGAKAQVQFDHNTDKLAFFAEDYTDYKYNNVDVAELNFTDAVQVASTLEDTLADVSVKGSTLVLNNQISLRIYVNVADTSAYTFTVDGKEVNEFGSSTKGKYIEIANIGTAKLDKFVKLTIAPKSGEGSIVYKVSPLSYVYAVNQGSYGQSLKDVCEAMFYYYDAVMNAYGLDQNVTFTTVASLFESTDAANAYSVPRGIEG